METRILSLSYFSMTLLLILSATAPGGTYEWGMKVTSNGTQLIALPVFLFVKNDVDAGMLTIYRSGASMDTVKAGANRGENFFCDIDDSNTLNPSWAAIMSGVYYVLIDNYYVEIHLYPNRKGGISQSSTTLRHIPLPAPTT